MCMATSTLWADLPLESPPKYDEEKDTLVRQSIIGQLLLCEMRVGYRNDPGFLEPVNEKMAFGSCVHYMLERDLIEGTEQTGLLVNMAEWVNELLVEQYDWDLERVDNPSQFFSELGVAYRTWRKQIRPKLKQDPIGIEEEMFLFLGEGSRGNIWMKGTPDAIFKTHLRDFKTAGRGWKPAKADVSIQASLYPALVKEHYDRSIQTFIFDVYDRSKSQWESLRVKRRVKDINSALLTAYGS